MKQYAKLMLATMMLLQGNMSAHAQRQDEYAKEKALITQVKRNPGKYIYAEATCETQEKAQSVAEEMFLENVNEYVASVKRLRSAGDIVINDQHGLQQTITMPRGSNMHRVFLYVKKSDIVAMKNPQVIVKESESKVEAIESTVKNDFSQTAKELAQVKTVAEMNKVLSQMKRTGRITAYGKYADLAEKSEWYLIVYDRNGSVKAILTDGDQRTNVATRQTDDLSNYPNHAVLGVKLAK